MLYDSAPEPHLPDFSPLEFSRRITLFTSELFRKIRLIEFLKSTSNATNDERGNIRKANDFTVLLPTSTTIRRYTLRKSSVPLRRVLSDITGSEVDFSANKIVFFAENQANFFADPTTPAEQLITDHSFASNSFVTFTPGLRKVACFFVCSNSLVQANIPISSALAAPPVPALFHSLVAPYPFVPLKVCPVSVAGIVSPSATLSSAGIKGQDALDFFPIAALPRRLHLPLLRRLPPPYGNTQFHPLRLRQFSLAASPGTPFPLLLVDQLLVIYKDDAVADCIPLDFVTVTVIYQAQIGFSVAYRHPYELGASVLSGTALHNVHPRLEHLVFGVAAPDLPREPRWITPAPPDPHPSPPPRLRRRPRTRPLIGTETGF